ncbi:hypothetical protein ACFSM5_07790 [Lacibacterium aquatile]|uniref:Uncharacterized protein n=1 Tax=Lacibacterium aquatile TaxID=1168082 RepID=A0ABW5DS66_9PROT
MATSGHGWSANFRLVVARLSRPHPASSPLPEGGCIPATVERAHRKLFPCPPSLKSQQHHNAIDERTSEKSSAANRNQTKRYLEANWFSFEKTIAESNAEAMEIARLGVAQKTPDGH